MEQSLLEMAYKKQTVIRQMFLYGVIGAGSALSDSSIYFLLTRLFSLNELVANFISVNVGITISFFLNTFFNFKLSSKLGRRAISFFAVGYIGLSISTLILFLGIHVMVINDFAVKVFSIFIVAILQFVLNKLITYGRIH